MNEINNFEMLPECIRKHFEELYLRSPLGATLLPLSPKNLGSTNSSVDIKCCHHVYIKIPYAGKLLKWEIIFNPDDYTFAPNFYFHNDKFLSDPDHETVAKEIPSLDKWNLEDPTCLSQILTEFMILYKKEQVNMLRSENMYSQFYEEYELLLTENGVDTVEVSVDGSKITFLVVFKIDCSGLPNIIQDRGLRWCNPGEDFAHLKILISKPANPKFFVYLQISPDLDHVLGNMLTTAVYNLKKHSTIKEYLSAVKGLINDRIEAVAKSFELKKAYVLNLVTRCSDILVEYDTETFNKVSFLFKLDDYQCLVMVKIGSGFPVDTPKVKLSSIYCQEGAQCNEILHNYPYNASSSTEVNIGNLLDYLEDAVKKFKNHRHAV